MLFQKNKFIIDLLHWIYAGMVRSTSKIRILSIITYCLLSCSLLGYALSPSPNLQSIDSLLKQHQAYEQAQVLLVQMLSQADTDTEMVEIYQRLIDVELRLFDFKKALSYIRKLERIIEQPLDPKLNYKLQYKKAYVYSYTGRYDLAILLFRRLIQQVEQEGGGSKRLARLYNGMGAAQIYLQLEKTEESFQKAIAYSQDIDEFNYPAYNNLIDFYITNLNYKAAGKYIDTLLQHATEMENHINLVSAMTKQTQLLAMIGQEKEARQVMEECRVLRQKHNIAFPASAYIFDSYVYQANGQLDSAIWAAELVLDFAIEKNEAGLVELCMPHLAKLYTQTGQADKAVGIYEKLIFMQKSQNKTSQIENISEMETEALAALPMVATAPANAWSYLPWALLLLVLMGWAYREFRPQSASNSQPANNPALEELREKLQIKNVLLTKSKLAQQQNIELLKSLKVGIRSLERDRSQLHKNINNLIHKINGSLHFQSQWKEINQHFSALFPSFLPRLKAQYPKLTITELRHCMFLKLNLTIDEVARILNIESTSVSSARYRLKKKIDIEQLTKLD